MLTIDILTNEQQCPVNPVDVDTRYARLDKVFGAYYSKENKIRLFVFNMKPYPEWKRMCVCVLAHEIVHAFFWKFVYRHSSVAYNKDFTNNEILAYKIQGFFMRLMRIKFYTLGYYGGKLGVMADIPKGLDTG